MPRRLLILDTELEMGGKERLLHEFITRADRSRFHVAVCCLRPGGYFKDRIVAMGVPFYDGLLHHRFDAWAFRQLEAVIRAERVEIVETFAHPNTVIFAALARLRSLVERVVVSYHAMATDPHGTVVRPYLRPLLRRLDGHIAVAEVQKRKLVATDGLRAESVRVIYNGVDTAIFRPAAADERATLRRSLGIPADEIVLMAVGSLKPIKGIDVLLDAFAPLAPRARLAVVGDGPDRAALEARARALRIDAKVSFLGLRDDVHQLYRAADALVLASRTEALPTVILEAMASGLPVVATNVGGVPEMVEPERSGVLVEPENSPALSDALQRVAASEDFRRRLGERGRTIVQEQFRIETMCEQRMNYFEELLERPVRQTAAASP